MLTLLRSLRSQTSHCGLLPQLRFAARQHRRNAECSPACLVGPVL
jgi:hypothetical protein